MTGADTYLFGGEQVALIARPHPVVLLRPSLPPLAAIALLAAAPNQVTVILFFIFSLRFSWDLGLWWMDRYILTTERILSLSGLLTKNVVSMPLAKITDLAYSRSLMGRILGYGTINLESAGQQGLDKIEYLPDPDHFYRAVMSLALGPRHDGPQSVDEAESSAQKRGQTLDLRAGPGGAQEKGDPATMQLPAVRQSDD